MTIRIILAFLAACLTATAADAARPFSPAMTCAALQGLVAQRGAVVISTSRTTYDRYVHDSRFCERTQVTRADWIRSADQPNCFIGYRCEEYSRDDWW